MTWAFSEMFRFHETRLKLEQRRAIGGRKIESNFDASPKTPDQGTTTGRLLES